MIYSVYAIYDRKAKVYSQPFYAVNNDVALRMLRSLVADKGTNIGQAPEDFTLYFLGAYDDEHGMFHCPKEAEPVANAAHLLGRYQQQTPRTQAEANAEMLQRAQLNEREAS